MAERLRRLSDSVRYLQFVGDRDNALETVLDRYLTSVDALVRGLQVQCERTAAHTKVVGTGVPGIRAAKARFEQTVRPWFEIAGHECLRMLTALRATTLTLSYAGEAEAIARTLEKPTKYTLDKDKLKAAVDRETPSGGKAESRVDLAFTRLLSAVVEAFQHSLVLESTPQETVERIRRAFPSSRKLKRPPNALRKIREKDTGRTTKPFLSSGVIAKEDWEHAVSDYLDDYLPIDRSPNGKMLIFSADPDGNLDAVERYDWEIEKEFTQDFIALVRSGENEAARENGITDFQWLAVIDDHTDECCAWRDGLSTEEIKDQLDGDRSDDRCNAINPPAHFNCRCRAIPMTEDLPENSGPDFGSFDEWLTQKGQAA